ncbi:right-handed parallel beta-helix repeat-containing protein [candidate division KSB1 bacterium]|nr:right-handed parallel beta-helix repeat-containing protein [candidate division KSB1 bacterium]
MAAWPEVTSLSVTAPVKAMLFKQSRRLAAMKSFRIFIFILLSLFVYNAALAVDYQKKQVVRDTVLTPGLSIGSISSNKNVTSFFNTLNSRNRTTTSSYGDSQITLVKLSPTVIAMLGGTGSGSYYGVDDNTIELYSQSGSTLMRLSTAWQDTTRKRLSGIRHTDYYAGADQAVRGGTANTLSGDVYLCEGTETITDTMIYANDNLRILGNRNYTLKVVKTETFTVAKKAIWIRSDYSRVEIEGFNINGNKNVSHSNSFDAGICISGAQYVTIRNMYIYNTGGDAITINRDYTGLQPLQRTKKVLISNCTFDVPYLYLESRSEFGDPWDFIGRCCVAITNAEEVIIENCWFKGGEAVGAIDLEPDDENEVANKVIIRNNVFEGYGQQGANETTTGCAIMMGSYGIPIQDVLIDGNFIFNYYRHGISFHIGGAVVGNDVVTRLTAANNFIFDNGYSGISVTAANNAVFEKNTIYRNGSAGIFIGSDSYDISILDNNIFENDYTGIWLDNGAQAASHSFIVSNNRVFNNGQVAGDGIRLTRAKKAVITDNLIYDSQGDSATQAYAIQAAEITKMRLADNLEYGNKNYKQTFDSQSNTFTQGNHLVGVAVKGTIQVDVSNDNAMYLKVLMGPDYINSDQYFGYCLFNKTRFADGPAGQTDQWYNIRSNSANVADSFKIYIDSECTFADWEAGDSVFVVSKGCINSVSQNGGAGFVNLSNYVGYTKNDSLLLEAETNRTARASADITPPYYLTNCDFTEGVQGYYKNVAINTAPLVSFPFQVKGPADGWATAIGGEVIYPSTFNVRNKMTLNKTAGSFDIIGDAMVFVQVYDVANENLLRVADFRRTATDIPYTAFQGPATLKSYTETQLADMKAIGGLIAGMLAINSTSGEPVFWNGSNWIPVSGGIGNVTWTDLDPTVQDTILNSPRVINVTNYGAVDDSSDSWTAVETMLTYAQDGDIYYFPKNSNGVYYFSKSLMQTGGLDLTFKFDPDVRVYAPDTLMFIDGTETASTTMKATAVQGMEYFLVNNSSGFDKGSLVALASNGAWYNSATYLKGEMIVIRRVHGDTIWIEGNLADTYIIPTENVVVVEYNHCSVKIEGLDLRYQQDDANVIAIRIRKGLNCQFKNVKIQNAGTNALELKRCYNTLIENPAMLACNKAGQGAAICLLDCYHTTIRDGYFYECREPVAASASNSSFPTRYVLVDGGHFLGGGIVRPDSTSDWGNTKAIDSHEAAEYITVRNAKIRGFGYGCYMRGNFCTMEGCDLSGRMYCAYWQAYGGGATVVGNTYTSGLIGRPHVTSPVDERDYQLTHFFGLGNFAKTDSAAYFKVSDNVAIGVTTSFGAIRVNARNLDLSNNYIRFNPVTGTSNYLYGPAGAVTLDNCTIKGEVLELLNTGSLIVLHGNITLSNSYMDYKLDSNDYLKSTYIDADSVITGKLTASTVEPDTLYLGSNEPVVKEEGQMWYRQGASSAPDTLMMWINNKKQKFVGTVLNP